MQYKLFDDKIVLEPSDTFSEKAIFECGQVFRYEKTERGYRIIATDKKAEVIGDDGRKTILTDSPTFFANYFDLHTDYDIILHNLSDDGLLGEAKRYGAGIRILKQDAFETLISFIISANNHIPRIKAIIERLCEGLGEKCDGYYAFPTAAAMAAKDESYYARLGAGYRAGYLAETARAVADGFDLEGLRALSTEQARKQLLRLKGVGGKVADCILLFGYGRTDVFPVDTWIKKVYAEKYGDCTPSQTAAKLVAEYGKLAGYAQQYVFYYKREGERKGR